MNNEYDRAVAKVIATAKRAQLQAVHDDVARRLEENRQRAALLDRVEEAVPHLEHLEKLYPGRSSTRELLEDAGVTCERLGLNDDDPELIDALMRENV